MADLISHHGVDLFRAAQAWQARYHARMAELGHEWLQEGRGALVPLIERDGTVQSDLARRAGLTRQAIQQHLDDLESDGIIRRIQDPEDARRRIVLFTERGLAILEAGNAVKRDLDREAEALLGAETFATLRRALTALTEG